MGRTEFLTWKTITSEPTVGKGNTIYESEMALFFECMQQCAQKCLTRADIVREAILRQLCELSANWEEEPPAYWPRCARAFRHIC